MALHNVASEESQFTRSSSIHRVPLPNSHLLCILPACRFSPRRTRSCASVVCAVCGCLLARGGWPSRVL